MKFKYLFLLSFIILLSSCKAKLTDSYQVYSQNDSNLKYRFFYPLKYDETKTYPLLVFLHGIGERGSDNELQLKYIDEVIFDKINRIDYPSFVLLPQSPKSDNWSSRKLVNKKIRQVFPIDDEPTRSLNLVMNLLDSLVNHRMINDKKVYLSGLSNGGMGSFELLKYRPNMFASAVVICGGGNTEWAKEFSLTTPIWIAHGADDDVVVPEFSINMVKAILENGGSPKFSLYENVGHDSWFNIFRDPNFLKWIFSHTKN